ncbi:hypothetical protein pb186bvf_002512 [Paramecium bursaria]
MDHKTRVMRRKIAQKKQKLRWLKQVKFLPQFHQNELFFNLINVVYLGAKTGDVQF